MVEIADNNGVVLVYPQGSNLPAGASHWNAAPPSSTSRSFVNKSNADDIGFFKELLDEINQDNTDVESENIEEPKKKKRFFFFNSKEENEDDEEGEPKKKKRFFFF
mgnify:CR=1 FL=1